MFWVQNNSFKLTKIVFFIYFRSSSYRLCTKSIWFKTVFNAEALAVAHQASQFINKAKYLKQSITMRGWFCRCVWGGQARAPPPIEHAVRPGASPSGARSTRSSVVSLVYPPAAPTGGTGSGTSADVWKQIINLFIISNFHPAVKNIISMC